MVWSIPIDRRQRQAADLRAARRWLSAEPWLLACSRDRAMMPLHSIFDSGRRWVKTLEPGLLLAAAMVKGEPHAASA